MRVLVRGVETIPVYVRAFGPLLTKFAPAVLVDARPREIEGSLTRTSPRN